MKLYVVNTNKLCDTNSEKYQCRYTEYQHAWDAACPTKSVDWN